MPNDIIKPVKISPTPGPTLVGALALAPVIPIIPPIAWATTSYDGHFTYGLSPDLGSPKPLIAPYTNLGFILANSSYWSPRRSITFGLKFSTITSACFTSSLKFSFPISVFKSNFMLFFDLFKLTKYPAHSCLGSSSRNGPLALLLSPVSLSIFITSAP